MPQNDGLDMSAFRAHVDKVYHNQLTDTPPAALDLFVPARNQTPIAGKNSAVALQSAVDRLEQIPAVNTDLTYTAPAHAGLDQAGEVHEDSAVSARNKLAQEALLKDPAALKLAFPKLMADLKRDNPGGGLSSGLDMAHIDAGLNDPNLSQDDKNLLTVFKLGYNTLSEDKAGGENEDTHKLGSDPKGITKDSLAIIDQAFNPKHRVTLGNTLTNLKITLEGATALSAAGGWLGKKFTGTADGASLGAAIGGVVGLAFGAYAQYQYETNQMDADMYDSVKKDYLEFEDAFAGKTSPAAQAKQ